MPDKQLDNQEISHLKEFFSYVSSGISKFGIKTIKSELKKLSMDYDVEIHPEFDFITDAICEYFKIPKNELFSNSRGSYTTARKICLMLTVEITGCKIVRLVTVFNRSRQLLHRWYFECKRLERDKKIDCINYYYHYDAIKEIINKKIKN